MSVINKINKYDKNKKKEIEKIINLKKNISFSFDKTKDLVFIKYEENKNKIIAGNFIFFGIYQPTNKLWIWASSIPGINLNQISKIQDMRKKSYLFENNNNNEILFIHQFLNNDILLIEDDKYLILIKKVLIFLSNGLFMLDSINNYGNQQFIGLINIKEKYI